MKLYVYCLAEHVDTPAVSRGVSGATVELVEIAGFSVLVSRAGETVPVTRENVLAHDSVVRGVLDRTTPLPFRFGTLTTEKELASYLETRKPVIKTRLELVSGCFEMSVKIISNADQAALQAEKNDLGPGAAFLERKRRDIFGSEQAKEVAAWLRDEVGEVREEQVSLCPTEKLIVAAAHLVEREQLGTYRDRVANARKLRTELHFLVSGPWAPYSFSNIDLEFKTQFGVS